MGWDGMGWDGTMHHHLLVSITAISRHNSPVGQPASEEITKPAMYAIARVPLSPPAARFRGLHLGSSYREQPIWAALTAAIKTQGFSFQQ